MKSFGSVFALPFLAFCTSSALAASADPPPSQPISPVSTVRNKPTAWDREAAAKYLDDRMDLWFEKARKLRTGQGNTACASCHNTVPYVLARPALRKAAGMSQPTPQEAKLLDETLRRVDTYGSHEPLVKGKDEQSRGTEAVLNLLILAGEDARQNRRAAQWADPQSARQSYGKSNVRMEPGIGWTSGMEPYESSDSVYYGAALAAIAVGTRSLVMGAARAMTCAERRRQIALLPENEICRAESLQPGLDAAGLHSSCRAC